MTPERLTMSVTEFAYQMGISRPSAYQLLHREDFPKIRVGRRVVIPRRELEAWLAKESTEGRVEG